MPEAPVAPAPPAPAAAPSAPAPAAPVAPAASAPATTPPAAEVPSTPTPVAPVAPTTPATPAAFDPKTSPTPPKSSDFSQDAEGIRKFITANTEWSIAHPEEAEKIRQAKIAAEDGVVPAEEKAAEVPKAEELPQPDAAKPSEEKPVVAATPVKIDEWATKSPELKAAFEKSPELRAEIMEMARANEAAKPVLDIVATPEEAQFAVDHAQRLVSLQSNWMLAGEDPEMVQPAWDQTVDMFKERDKDGKEILGADGKPKLAPDFKPFVRKNADYAIEDAVTPILGQISDLEKKLTGSYPTEEAREADRRALEELGYTRDALNYVRAILKDIQSGGSTLPTLPANATPEQIEFQKKLEAQAKELDEKQGRSTTESRKAATTATNREVQRSYETGLTSFIETQVNAMKERGEYLPDFVLNDKWINPQTGKVTNLSAFGVKLYQSLNDKINKNPLHAAKLMSLEALGAAGKDARIAELKRLQALYLPKLFEAEVRRIQDGIRATSGKKPPANTVARTEPTTQGTVVPSAMSKEEVRTWAEGEAKKSPNWGAMSSNDREALIIQLAMKKRFGS